MSTERHIFCPVCNGVNSEPRKKYHKECKTELIKYLGNLMFEEHETQINDILYKYHDTHMKLSQIKEYAENIVKTEPFTPLKIMISYDAETDSVGVACSKDIKVIKPIDKKKLYIKDK